MEWKDCDHKWTVDIDSQAHSETKVAVHCKKCWCPGEKNLKTGEVFWPAT